jgi:hypothetical protein
MKLVAITVVLAAILFSGAACRQMPAPPPRAAPVALPADALAPSPRLIVGRVVAVDPAQGFAFVELVADAPPAATARDTELVARTLELRETATLRTARYLRGRILGTRVVAGAPSVGDEVVWLAP